MGKWITVAFSNCYQLDIAIEQWKISIKIVNILGAKCELDRNCDTTETKYQKACLNGGKCSTDNNGNPSCNCDETYFYGEYCEHVHPCHPMKNSCDGYCERSTNSLTPEDFVCHDSQI